MKIQEKTEKKVFAYMAEHNMVSQNDSIVLGVSGGADSVCLLLLLAEYAKQVPLSLSVVHVNHGIRQQAAQDAAYVKRLCEQLGIPFFLKEVNVPKLAEEEKCSEEAVGRSVRYEAFEERVYQIVGAQKKNKKILEFDERQSNTKQQKTTHSSVKIAVAHNANDNAETMLFHLFRGTGLKGLCGILPVRDNIIRPILCLERREIEEYLTAQQIAWCEDHTNQEDDYIRNRIRHHILPYADQKIVTGAVSHINQTVEMLRETEEFLEQQTREAMEQAGVVTNYMTGEINSPLIEISCSDFCGISPIFQKRILLSLAKKLSPTGKDISLVHVEDVLSLFTREGNRDIHLPFGILVKRRYEKVYLEREENIEQKENKQKKGGTAKSLTQELDDKVEVLAEGQGCVPELQFTHIFPKKDAKPPTNQYTKWFDYDKIAMFAAENGEGIKRPCLRYRQAGDYLTIADDNGGVRHKTLKDYMINEKIPRECRDHIPILAVDNHVVWLIGHRISEYFKVTENTTSILQVQLVCKGDCAE